MADVDLDELAERRPVNAGDEYIQITREERDWLRDRIRELEAALEPELVDAAIKDGTMEAVIGEHPGIQLMVASFRESLADAENYVEARVVDDEEDEAYVVRVQRASGKTPHQKRVKAEVERDEARETIQRIQALLEHPHVHVHGARKAAREALAGVDADKEN